MASVTTRDKDVAHVAAPPSGAVRRADGVPGPVNALLLSDEEQTALRTKDAPAATPPRADAPETGLTALNNGARTVYLVLDGIPAAYLAPGGRVRLGGLRAGKYRVEWRTLLGGESTPPVDAEVPALLRYPLRPEGTDDDPAK